MQHSVDQGFGTCLPSMNCNLQQVLYDWFWYSCHVMENQALLKTSEISTASSACKAGHYWHPWNLPFTLLREVRELFKSQELFVFAPVSFGKLPFGGPHHSGHPDPAVVREHSDSIMYAVWAGPHRRHAFHYLPTKLLLTSTGTGESNHQQDQEHSRSHARPQTSCWPVVPDCWVGAQS